MPCRKRKKIGQKKKKKRSFDFSQTVITACEDKPTSVRPLQTAVDGPDVKRKLIMEESPQLNKNTANQIMKTKEKPTKEAQTKEGKGKKKKARRKINVWTRTIDPPVSISYQ